MLSWKKNFFWWKRRKVFVCCRESQTLFTKGHAKRPRKDLLTYAFLILNMFHETETLLLIPRFYQGGIHFCKDAMPSFSIREKVAIFLSYWPFALTHRDKSSDCSTKNIAVLPRKGQKGHETFFFQRSRSPNWAEKTTWFFAEIGQSLDRLLWETFLLKMELILEMENGLTK